MWAYNKCIPISVLKREYPGHPDEGLEIAKMQFVAECGEVLGKAVNVSVAKDPRRYGYILTAKLITEPQEADMATGVGGQVEYQYSATELIRRGDMVVYKEKTKLPVVVGSYYRDLKREINEWLKM